MRLNLCSKHISQADQFEEKAGMEDLRIYFPKVIQNNWSLLPPHIYLSLKAPGS